MKVGGKAATTLPKIPSPALNHPKKVIFMDHQKMECQIPRFQKLRKQQLLLL